MEDQNREARKQSLICFRPNKATTAVLLVATFFGVSSLRAQAPLTVDWQDGHLSVTAEQVSLAQILQAVALPTGVEIRGLEGLQEQVSVRFANLSLREGLQKLLTPVNYFLVEKTLPQGGTRPTLVLISGRQVSQPAQMAVSEEGAKPEEGAAAEGDLGQRLAALSAFAAQGNEEALRKAAADSDQAIRAAALALLARQDPAAATTLAVAAARGPDLTQQLTGLQALSQLDNPLAVQALGEALADEDVGVRESTIHSLAGQTGPDATRLLSQALKDQDLSIRVLALEALSVRGEEGQEALKSAVDTRDPLVRSRAAELLEQMKTDEEIPTAGAE